MNKIVSTDFITDDVQRLVPVDATATTPKNAAVAKLMKAWEAKTTQRTAKGAGLTLMALSLAACNDDNTTAAAPTTPTTPVTPAGQTFTLTIGVDAVTGTAANDTISGARADTVQTLNTTDVIDGGAGTDSLSATITGGLATSSISNVETITFTDLATADAAIVFSTATTTHISGVQTVNIIGSTGGDTVLTRLVDNATVNFNNTVDDITVTFADSVLAGTADTVTVGFSGVVLAGAEAVTIGSVTDVDGDYETLVVNSTGAASDLNNSVAMGADATTVTVNASAAIDFGATASFAAAATINASASTAAVTLVLADGGTAGTAARTITGGAGADNIDVSALVEANVGVLTVNGGAGNDVITLGTFVDTTMVIAGGAGTDTIIVNETITAANSVGISGFEALRTTEDQVMSNFINNNGMLTFRLTDGIASITNVATGSAALQLVSGAGTALMSRLIDGAADTVSIVPTAATTTTTLSVADEETVSINAADGALTLTNFTTTDMTSLTVTGDNAVNVGTSSGTAVATVNVSALDAAFTGIFAASTAAMTVTGNSGANAGVMTITTGSGNDVITGGRAADIITTAGAGDDIITGGRGADQITLGTGADTLIFEATGALNGNDVITGFGGGLATAGGDVLDMDAFLTGTVNQHGGTTTAINIFLEADNNDVNVTNQAVLFEGTLATYSATTALTAAEAIAMVVAEIQGAGNAFSITSGGKAVFVVSDITSQASFALYVDDSVGATAGTIAADDVAVVASLGAFDIDALITTNFDIA